MKRFTTLGILLLLMPIAHADLDLRQRGEHVFNRWCIDCHGAGKGHYGDRVPGTDALAVKYQGALPALLTERKDLTPELVSYFVRNGISIMPYFRKTEISDAELDALGFFLQTGN